jgi:enoyl-CoA hydratase/carnithine racemase
MKRFDSRTVILFSAKVAERHDLINRVCTPEELDKEVAALIEVILAKNPVMLRRSKFVLNEGADLPLSGAMAFEIPIQPFANKPGRLATDGMEDFADSDRRAARRWVSRDFWQD